MIPVLEDGDVVIWESNSIVRYLAARYGAGWIWEEDPALRANRLALLRALHRAMNRVADLARLAA